MQHTRAEVKASGARRGEWEVEGGRIFRHLFSWLSEEGEKGMGVLI